MKKINKPKKEKTDLPPEIQFKLALDYLYRQAHLEGWELTANLIGAASDSIVEEYYRSLSKEDSASSGELFLVPNSLGGKAN